ncbi:hypothetical protein L1887_53622 [Cichorium endivia]|nr:hypothetical protein L1887_53622 [Cichorium endivia]
MGLWHKRTPRPKPPAARQTEARSCLSEQILPPQHGLSDTRFPRPSGAPVRIEWYRASQLMAHASSAGSGSCRTEAQEGIGDMQARSRTPIKTDRWAELAALLHAIRPRVAALVRLPERQEFADARSEFGNLAPAPMTGVCINEHAGAALLKLCESLLPAQQRPRSSLCQLRPRAGDFPPDAGSQCGAQPGRLALGEGAARIYSRQLYAPHLGRFATLFTTLNRNNVGKQLDKTQRLCRAAPSDRLCHSGSRLRPGRNEPLLARLHPAGRGQHQGVSLLVDQAARLFKMAQGSALCRGTTTRRSGPEFLWEDDAAKMANATLSYARISEFDWAILEPTDGTYDWSLLDNSIERLCTSRVSR